MRCHARHEHHRRLEFGAFGERQSDRRRGFPARSTIVASFKADIAAMRYDEVLTAVYGSADVDSIESGALLCLGALDRPPSTRGCLADIGNKKAEMLYS